MHDYTVSSELQGHPGTTGTFFGIGLHCNMSFTADGQWKLVVERRRRGPGGQLLLFVHDVMLSAPYVKEPVQTVVLEDDWVEKVIFFPARKEISCCKLLWIHEDQVLGKISLPIAQKEEEKKQKEAGEASEEKKQE